MAKTTLQKVTSRGQITLPIRVREKWNTQYISVRETDGGIFIFPEKVDTRNTEQEYTVFDAIRDNKGKGLKARDLVTLLNKL